MEKTKKFVSVIDVCLPDYFAGYHKPVIQVPIYKDTYNCKEIAECLQSELSLLWDMFEDYSEDMSLFEAYIKELQDKKSEIFYSDSNFRELEDTDFECAYMYFAVVQPVTKYGITFLNS